MRKLEPKQGGNSGQKPFLQQAFNLGLVKEDDCLEILSIRETQSKSGYLLETDKCVQLVFKSSPWAEPLVEILLELSELDPGFALMLTVREENTGGMELWVDEDEARLWTVLKKFGGLTSYEHTMSAKNQTVSISRKQRKEKAAPQS